MKYTVFDVFTIERVAINLLGGGGAIHINVRRKPGDTFAGDDDILLALYQKIEGVKQFPNNEVDLMVPIRNSGSWARAMTLHIPKEHLDTVKGLFGNEIELIGTDKDKVLKYLVDNA